MKDKSMTSSKKIWFGRGILLVIVLAIIGTLAYLYATSKKIDTTPRRADTAKPEQHENSKPASVVKDAYEAYFTAAYKAKKPNRDVALATFKQSMTENGANALDNSTKKDPVLCVAGEPEELSYTEPTEANNIAVITVVTSVKSGGTARAIATLDMSQGKIVSVRCN